MPLTRSQRQKAVEGEKDDEVIEKEKSIKRKK